MITGRLADREFNAIECIVSMLLFHEIWMGRQLRVKPSFATIETNMIFRFASMINCSNTLKNAVVTCENLWCRHWADGGQHGRG